jgi:geranylgeranyl pyrophosphate synthase
MIYQLRDDIMDMTATKGQLGKPAGQDLQEGIYNLPALFALADPEQGPTLKALLGKSLNDAEREQARQLVVSTAGIKKTIEAAEQFLEEAEIALSKIPDEKLRVGFSALISSLLKDLPAY